METLENDKPRAARPRRKPAARRSSETSSDWVIGKHLRYKGRDYKPGEPMPSDMADHLRFDSLVSTGYLRAVRR